MYISLVILHPMKCHESIQGACPNGRELGLRRALEYRQTSRLPQPWEYNPNVRMP